MVAREKSRVHRILLAAAGSPLSSADWPEGAEELHLLANALMAQGVHGLLALHQRTDAELAGDFKLQLQAAALRTAANHRHRLQDMHEALDALAAERVQPIVLKGPALVERYYKDPTLRPYGDIDLCVHPREFRASLKALERRGFELLDRNWDFIVRDVRGQLHLRRPGGGLIELHWHLVNGRRQRRSLRMRSAELWDAVRSGTIDGAKCYLLSPGDEIAYLCVHAAMHGCNRLLWLIDIAIISQSAEVDWKQTSRRLRQWRFGAGGYFVLNLAQRWAGADIPLAELEELRPGPVTLRAFEALVARWDLGIPERQSRLRELFFATAGDGPVTRAALSADFVIPPPGQPEHSVGPRWRQELHRFTFGTVLRVRGKLARGGGEQMGSEYRAAGDPLGGRTAYLSAVESLADG